VRFRTQNTRTEPSTQTRRWRASPRVRARAAFSGSGVPLSEFPGVQRRRPPGGGGSPTAHERQALVVTRCLGAGSKSQQLGAWASGTGGTAPHAPVPCGAPHAAFCPLGKVRTPGSPRRRSAAGPRKLQACNSHGSATAPQQAAAAPVPPVGFTDAGESPCHCHANPPAALAATVPRKARSACTRRLSCFLPTPMHGPWRDRGGRGARHGLVLLLARTSGQRGHSSSLAGTTSTTHNREVPSLESHGFRVFRRK
jgi:hypothetical protein